LLYYVSNEIYIKQVLAFAVAAGLVYSIAASFYIRRMSYEETFILYVGNFLFAAMIGIFVGWFYKKHESNIGTIELIVSGAKTAGAGIVAACVFCVIMILIFSPGVFKPEAVSHVALKDAPGQFSGKNQGFGKILFLNAILGNAGASFFISLLIPFSVMKNLYGDEKKNRKEAPSSKATESPKTNYKI